MIAWITLNEAGVVRAASLIGYTDRETLREWEKAGRQPVLVDFGDLPVTINKPLPDTAQVLQRGAFAGEI